MGLGPFKARPGTPFPDQPPGIASFAASSRLCPRGAAAAPRSGLGRMSRIYQDSALRNKAVRSARLPGAWEPAAHQG